MLNKIFCSACLIVLIVVPAFAQTPTPAPLMQTAPTPVNLETILTEAEKQTVAYQEAFKDLLAVETKTFEEYDKSGELDGETVIESNFLVYQSPKQQNAIIELRNVLKVDGKLIPESQTRADRFLSELDKTKTSEKELDKLQEEGSRYDKTIQIINFTLYEAITLAQNLRPYFNFKLDGMEVYDSADVYVVSYQQTKKSPFITFNEKRSQEAGIKADFDIKLPGGLKKNNKFLRGRLWIDAKTFQIRREERQVTVQTNNNSLIAQEIAFEYTPSEFGILVPKKIIFLDNKLVKAEKSNEFNAIKDTKVTFDYSKFRKTNVEVQIIDEP